MNKSAKGMIKNLSYSVASSVISMVISAFVVLIVPRSMSTEGYGYYQLYVLYIGYAGFFQFGLIDGIYIRYGGAYYDKIERHVLFSQWITLGIMQLVVFTAIGFFSTCFTSREKMYVLLTFGVGMVLANTRGMLTYVLQATNRIKEGAISSVIGRIAFLVTVIIMLSLNVATYRLVILADIIGRLLALLYSTYECKEIVFNKISTFKLDIRETKTNIGTGFFLMLSSICSLLIMGLVRFAIENRWGIETFANVSLTVSLSSLMVTFVNSVSLVLFPALRRSTANVLSVFYRSLKTSLIPILYSILALYYPVSRLLIAWLPQYESGLRFMAILFPLCIYEGRMALLNYTYLKTTFNTKQILKTNALSVAVSAFLTVISVYVIGSIPIAMLSLLVSIAFRCLYTDYYIAHELKMKFMQPAIEEAVLMSLFVLFSWFMDSYVGTVLFAAVLILYYYINNKSIRIGLNDLRSITNNE